MIKSILTKAPIWNSKSLVERKLFGPKVTVLLFHHFESKYELNRFRNTIERLASFADFICPERFKSFQRGEYQITRDSFLVTFDDGFQSAYWATKEVLNPLGIKSIHFIAPAFLTSCVNDDDQLNFIRSNLKLQDVSKNNLAPFRPMDQQQIQNLHSTGHVFGSHTNSHPRLSDLSNNEITNELIEAGRWIESNIGYWPEFFAPPFGDLDAISHCAIKIGLQKHQFLFTGLRGHIRSDNTRIVPRQSLNPKTSSYQQMNTSQGALDLPYRSSRRKLDRLQFQ